jgi:hypothetical protein
MADFQRERLVGRNERMNREVVEMEEYVQRRAAEYREILRSLATPNVLHTYVPREVVEKCSEIEEELRRQLVAIFAGGLNTLIQQHAFENLEVRENFERHIVATRESLQRQVDEAGIAAINMMLCISQIWLGSNF